MHSMYNGRTKLVNSYIILKKTENIVASWKSYQILVEIK